MKRFLVPLFALLAVVLQLSIAKSSTTCNCGWINKGRIVSGNITSKHKYPLVAAIIHTKYGQQDCGGSIITPWHVLTAAHCSSDDLGQIKIKVGINNWRKESGDVYDIEKTFVHEEYDQGTFVNDIAILLTNKEIKFNQNVGPVCMPNKRISIVGQRVTVMGWGFIQDGGPASDDLREVELGVVSKAECKKKWNHGAIDLLFDRTICTYEKGKDSCQEDSGGPVVWRDPEINRLVLAGAVSFGGSCGGPQPGFNTDVSAYLDWINSKIAESKPGVHTCSKV